MQTANSENDVRLAHHQFTWYIMANQSTVAKRLNSRRGLCVLDLARIGADVQGVASFHGLFMPPGNTTGNSIKAKVLALHGHQDPMVPVNAVISFEKELIEAGAELLRPGVSDAGWQS